MTATTTYKPGDVVLIPFPFTDLTTVKYRPAIVISSARFNKTQYDIIAVAVTSNPYAERKEYGYTLGKEECKRAGLFSPSTVKVGKITTIDQRLIRKRIGYLSHKTVAQISTHLHTILNY